MLTAAQLRDYLGLPAGSNVAGLMAGAVSMLDREIGGQYVPAEVYDLALKELCSALDLRRRNPGGIVSYGGVDQVARLNRDPMSSVRPILAAWMVNL